MTHVQVQCAIDDPGRADAIVETLLADHLIACGQRIGPVRSRYWWEGRPEEADEWLVLVKTRADLAPAVVGSRTGDGGVDLGAEGIDLGRVEYRAEVDEAAPIEEVGDFRGLVAEGEGPLEVDRPAGSVEHEGRVVDVDRPEWLPVHGCTLPLAPRWRPGRRRSAPWAGRPEAAGDPAVAIGDRSRHAQRLQELLHAG